MMRKMRQNPLLHFGLAAALACGLLPAAAFAIDAGQASDPPPATPEIVTTEATDASDEGAPEAASPEGLSTAAAGIGDAFALALAAATPEAVATPVTQADDNAGVMPQADGTNFGLVVSGGVEGTDYKFEKDVSYDRKSRNNANTLNSTLQKLTILTSKPLTIKNQNPATATNATIWVNPGVQANLTFDGVNIASDIPCQIERNRDGSGKTVEPKTSLRITLAAGSSNTLNATDGKRSPGIHCGEGTILVIDDDVPNVDTTGKEIEMDPKNYPGKIPAGVTFVGNDGKTYTAGTTPGDDRLNLLESANPGTLTVYGSKNVSGIGSVEFETTGHMTFDGGKLYVTARGAGDGTNGRGAAIGGGSAGCGGTIIFNGGYVETWTSYHGASIGGGAWAHNGQCPEGSAYRFQDSLDNGLVNSAYGSPNTVGANGKTWAGDIYINGGTIIPHSDAHGNAIGQGCCSWNKDHEIVVAGGTVLPDTNEATSKGGKPRVDCVAMGIGAQDGAVYVIGGSVRIGKFTDEANKSRNELFQAYINGADSDSTAFGAYPVDTTKVDNPAVTMITIDLGAEVIKKDTAGKPLTDGNNAIVNWDLTVAGVHYNYGAPAQFTGGKLFLWLPSTATAETVAVTLSYIDEDGNVQDVDPLFRTPGQSGTLLKRYIDFNLPSEYTSRLSKYYDGTPLPTYNLNDKNNWITTDETIPKEISDPNAVTYKYQQFDRIDGNPLHPEISTDAKGEPLKTMPSDAGVLKFTLTSTQYSNSTDPKYADFKESYWGHRATGWCEILPTTSKIDLVSATWFDGKDGSESEDSRNKLTVNATVKKGDADPDGNPIPDTAQAPRGYIQLFVDGQAVGDPVKMVFAGDLDDEGKVIPADSKLINAQVVTEGNGSYTTFQYVFVPATQDMLVPDATSDNRHIVSVQYLPPEVGSIDPANYLASTNPADDPTVPSTEVAIDPIDPETNVTLDPNPNPTDPDLPEPEFALDPTGPKPSDPNSNPYKPGDKTWTGEVSTTYGDTDPEGKNAGFVTLKIHTDSRGPIYVLDDSGQPFEAKVVTDENGKPVRNPDGTVSVEINPTKVGNGPLRIRQDPNGAYTGTTWEIAVQINPNPKIVPDPSVSKTAENLTHPEGPTQPGDRIRYTLTADNPKAGSAWNNVVLSDALPAALTLDEGSVYLVSPSEHYDGAITRGGTGVGSFDLSAPGADGRPVLTVPVGSVYGTDTTTVTFECTVNDDAVGEGKEAAAIENIAEATGTHPDPDNPSGPELPANPDPSDPVTPPGGSTVAPGDPALRFDKAVANATRPDAKMTQVGDTLTYTITLANDGAPSTCLLAAVISDPLPAGIELVPGTITMKLPDGTSKPVDDSAYDAASRTVAVSAGDVWGGKSVVLAFDCKVTVDALGQDNANVANLTGTIPSSKPGDLPTAVGGAGEPVNPPDDEPIFTTPPADPPAIVGADPATGDVVVTKDSTNLSRDDGTTRIGDTVRYTVTLSNNGVGTSWMDAVIRDDVPVGIEPITGTIKMTLPDGTELPVSDSAYKSDTRVLSVSAGRVHGGQTVLLVFDALVTEEAAGADIGNQAYALGKPPSKWNPDGAVPEAGQPFDPPAGWADFEQTSDRVTSNVSYAPGTDATHAPLMPDGDPTPTPGTGGDKPTGLVDDTTTIKHIQNQKLAVTGDIPLAALPLTLIAAAGALLVLTTRRMHRRHGKTLG